MNKLKILSILPALVLCSCGAKKNKFAGTYQFRLGKSDGNHMEVTATITDDNDSKVEGYKIMTLTGDLGDQFNVMTIFEELEDELDNLAAKVDDDELPPEVEAILKPLADLLPAFVKELKEEIKTLKTIPFFYKDSGHKNAKYGNRLEVGTHVLADIFAKLREKHADNEDFIGLIDAMSGFLQLTGFFDENLFIQPAVSKFAFNAFVNKKGLTFQVPISKEDVNQQFIWYGFENNFLEEVTLPENYMDKMPGVKGEDRFGTHPAKEYKNNVVTKDEAAQVNKTFAYEFSKSSLYNNDEEKTEQARFVLNTEGSQPKLYLAFEGDGPIEAKPYTGQVKIGDEYLPITLNVNEDGLCLVESNGKTGPKEGFYDNSVPGGQGAEFRFRDVVSDPFEFRDFNVVDVGLNKVEL